ncbi:MAG TPA: response regulator [Polyangiaceae bacterium]|nr:response regulator [Polyangiaceae bacterium]
MTVHRRGRAALRVLCVDDDELVLNGTVRMLADFDVVRVADPCTALERLCHSDDIDVVVSDVMMPEMTGPELYVACSRHSPVLASRFIFASGDLYAARTLLDAAVERVRAVDAPMLIAKPLSQDTLLAAVAGVVERVGVAQRSPFPQSGTYRVARASSWPELGESGS